MTTRFILLLLLVTLLLIVTACTTINPDSPGTFSSPIVMSEVDRVSPTVDDATMRQVSSDNNAFAFDLYQRLAIQEEGNFIFSPYSIDTAFAMVYAGARGNTEAEMAQTFHYSLPQDELHVALNRLEQDLTAGSGEEGKFQLNIANAIWGQKEYEFNQSYLDLLAAQYGAGLRVEDFKTEAGRGEAVDHVNEWVNTETQGKIPSVVDDQTFTEDTKLVLANAIYFYGDWARPFNGESTRPQVFHALDGSENNVDMMYQMAGMEYGEGDGWQAVSLPYADSNIRMIAILPEDGTFSDFDAGFGTDKFNEVLEQVNLDRDAPIEVLLALPKFNYETTIKTLPETLQSMGTSELFIEGGADLSGIEPKQELFVSKVIHKATITVDEEGTEAAAVTVIVADGAGSAAPPEDYVELTFDRPFLYVIQDEITGTVLFVGRVEKL